MQSKRKGGLMQDVEFEQRHPASNVWLLARKLGLLNAADKRQFEQHIEFCNANGAKHQFVGR
jgi:hypothetical protein